MTKPSDAGSDIAPYVYCGHGNSRKIGQTFLRRRNPKFWKDAPFDVMIGGFLRECLSCHYLFFTPTNANIPAVDLVQLR